ncbi:MAG: hypothetical protein LWW93_13095 [Hyphomicrobiales bacterium]|nr:hypothetical protein [Hyphomicrobiales bacterium]
MTTSRANEARSEIEDLLPWYANGRLAPADRRRVEAALTADGELARRLELVREEMAETIFANEQVTPSSSRAFEALMAGIAAEPKRASAIAIAKRSLVERIGEAIAALAPRRLAYATAAALALVVVQAAVIGGVVGEGSGGGFQTASQGEPAASGPTVLVAFAPDLRMADLTAFLKRHGASLAEGPKANGFFRLRLAEGTDAAAVAERMKSETKIVSFVQASP